MDCRKTSCPINSIGDGGVKLKAIPINLQWVSRHKSSDSSVNGGCGGTGLNAGELPMSNGFVLRGPTCKRPWFRLPPKVQIVPGILGRAPSAGTRVDHQQGSEPKVGEEARSGHHKTQHYQPGGLSIPIHIEGANPNPSACSSDPIPLSPLPILKSNLAKFVGHLWKGASSKSFAVAVCFEPAKTVTVKMF